MAALYLAMKAAGGDGVVATAAVVAADAGY